MSLNCLTCQVLRRTDSENEEKGRYNDIDNTQELSNFSLCLVRVERSWSGNLAPPTRTSKTGAHRLQNCSSGPMEFPNVTPRLQRCSGMRRDWSFEDLCRQMNKG